MPLNIKHMHGCAECSSMIALVFLASVKVLLHQLKQTLLTAKAGYQGPEPISREALMCHPLGGKQLIHSQ